MDDRSAPAPDWSDVTLDATWEPALGDGGDGDALPPEVPPDPRPSRPERGRRAWDDDVVLHPLATVVFVLVWIALTGVQVGMVLAGARGGWPAAIGLSAAFVLCFVGPLMVGGAWLHGVQARQRDAERAQWAAASEAVGQADRRRAS
jgi:hypothetical protein